MPYSVLLPGVSNNTPGSIKQYLHVMFSLYTYTIGMCTPAIYTRPPRGQKHVWVRTSHTGIIKYVLLPGVSTNTLQRVTPGSINGYYP